MSLKTAPQLTVFRGFGDPGSFTWSPFVIKLEARLRFDSISYGVAGGTPKSAPRGKIPYVELGERGAQGHLSDSALIIKSFIRDDILTDLNAKLSPSQRAQDLAIRALMEDKLYFYGTREKWCDNYYTMRSNALAPVPWPLQTLLGLVVYRGVTNNLYGQGTGRLTDDEVAVLKGESWESVDALLCEARSRTSGQGPFWALGGDAPTEADSTLFGFIASALICDAAPTTEKIVRGYPAIVEYAERIHKEYFPDYQRWS
ncbi:hypothetical protein FZEAL_4118 [Fusarium zealandicum]|uniref:Thioredoxin-like fold domain-containing protein n=1 Tax=Fusarium zealandicum TaxID=1053134 RepID=A0A8H4UMH8_9HYPO|nr:hypothetical protein FZEAL_4118 [Fusarium zealandicum]